MDPLLSAQDLNQKQPMKTYKVDPSWVYQSWRISGLGNNYCPDTDLLYDLHKNITNTEAQIGFIIQSFYWDLLKYPWLI